jgi:hypothetical protein
MKDKSKEEIEKPCQCPCDKDGFCLKCHRNTRHSCTCYQPPNQQKETKNEYWADKLAKLLDKLYIPSGAVCEESIKSFISSQKEEWEMAERERLVKEIEGLPIDKAHTYSSENAEDYRIYDAGQENYKKKVINLINSSN